MQAYKAELLKPDAYLSLISNFEIVIEVDLPFLSRHK
jgi:hypothetical protein